MLCRRKVQRSCQYCVHGARIDSEQVVCSKKGLVSFSGGCRRFRYDPLKRIPPRPKALDFSRFDQEDFSL